MAHASVVYVSASTNRFSHAAHASHSSLVAFGSSKLIALWNVADECDQGVYETLPGHQGLVTCVRLADDNTIISADDKGFLLYWRRIDSKWKIAGGLQAHSKSISALSIYDQYVVTGSSDALVKIWELNGLNSGELREVQAISLQGIYPLSLALAHLPQSEAIILAVAGTDRVVQIWTRSGDTFVRSVTLSGHEDWVRSLAFYPPATEEEPLVLASGSQDATIRLWKIEPFTKSDSISQSNSEQGLNDELLDAFEASLGDLIDAEEGGRQISLKRHILNVNTNQGIFQQFTVTFDALLVGHEAGITSLSWKQRVVTSAPTLLSTSVDSSLILWSPSTILASTHDKSSSIWINRQRFGDIGGQRLGGFVGGLWAQNGKEALAWGWGGGWRRWRCNDQVQGPEGEAWNEVGAIGGHKGPVKGLDWSPEGHYLASVSIDQTTRIHGAIPTSIGDGTVMESWHELGRPQVHGYDLLGVAFLDALKFISIADEKVARVFEAPRTFVDAVNSLGVANLQTNERDRAASASVPPLGLSNKAISETQSHHVGAQAFPISGYPARRPFEGELAGITLWPEIEKIFGHGYESISLTVSRSRRLIATACKATTAEHAVVRVYETEKWQLVGQPLEGHSLTVTGIAFSPDDRFVLTVSRDRSWMLFESRDNKDFVPVAADKSHARIIWDCAWAHEGDIFATASRDKSVKIWKQKEHSDPSKWVAVATIKTKEAATAVAFDAEDLHSRRWLAIGLETGDILIYVNARSTSSDWQLALALDSTIVHVDHIHQLAWRPTSHNDTKHLATCSEDGTLKVLIVHVGTG